MIPRAFTDLIPDGKSAQWTMGTVTQFVHRRGAEIIITAHGEAPPPPATPPADPRTERFHALWKLLEAGAETPEKRLALARSMLQRLPCGPCAKEWGAAMEERPPAVETKEAWDRWLWGEHNRINERLGKGFFPWPEK